MHIHKRNHKPQSNTSTPLTSTSTSTSASASTSTSISMSPASHPESQLHPIPIPPRTTTSLMSVVNSMNESEIDAFSCAVTHVKLAVRFALSSLSSSASAATLAAELETLTRTVWNRAVELETGESTFTSAAVSTNTLASPSTCADETWKQHTSQSTPPSQHRMNGASPSLSSISSPSFTKTISLPPDAATSSSNIITSSPPATPSDVSLLSSPITLTSPSTFTPQSTTISKRERKRSRLAHVEKDEEKKSEESIPKKSRKQRATAPSNSRQLRRRIPRLNEQKSSYPQKCNLFESLTRPCLGLSSWLPSACLNIDDLHPALMARQKPKTVSCHERWHSASIGTPHTMSVSPCRSTFVAAGQKGVVSLFTMSHLTQTPSGTDKVVSSHDSDYQYAITAWKGHQRAISHVQYVNQHTLVSSSDDGTLALWNIHDTLQQPSQLDGSIELLHRLNHNELHHGGISSMHHIERQIATASNDSTIRITHLTDSSLTPSHVLRVDDQLFITHIEWRDVNVLASAGMDGCVRIYDLRCQPTSVIQFTHKHVVNTVSKTAAAVHIHVVSWRPYASNYLLSESLDIHMLDIRYPHTPTWSTHDHWSFEYKSTIYETLRDQGVATSLRFQHPIYYHDGIYVVIAPNESTHLYLFDSITGMLQQRINVDYSIHLLLDQSNHNNNPKQTQILTHAKKKIYMLNLSSDEDMD